MATFMTRTAESWRGAGVLKDLQANIVAASLRYDLHLQERFQSAQPGFGPESVGPPKPEHWHPVSTSITGRLIASSEVAATIARALTAGTGHFVLETEDGRIIEVFLNGNLEVISAKLIPDMADHRLKAILEREFSVTVGRVWTDVRTGQSRRSYAQFLLGNGDRFFTVSADWRVDSTVEAVAVELADKSRSDPARG